MATSWLTQYSHITNHSHVARPLYLQYCMVIGQEKFSSLIICCMCAIQPRHLQSSQLAISIYVYDDDDAHKNKMIIVQYSRNYTVTTSYVYQACAYYAIKISHYALEQCSRILPIILNLCSTLCSIIQHFISPILFKLKNHEYQHAQSFQFLNSPAHD